MRISAPNPRPTPVDARLIAFLDEVLSRTSPVVAGSNEGGRLTLSDTEADRLHLLLCDYVEDDEVKRRLDFVEAITDPTMEPIARELYFRGRTDTGRSRAASSQQWQEFRDRIGQPGRSIRGVAPMDEATFLQMEMRLLRKLGIGPVSARQCLETLAGRFETAVRHTSGRMTIASGLLLDNLKALTRTCDRRIAEANRALTPEQGVGLLAFVADGTAFFTTRDWSVASAISTFAGAGAAGLLPVGKK